MNRSFYSFAIFFTVLYIIVAFLQSIFYFQLGRQIYWLESFPAWYLFVNILSLAGSLIFLKYFHNKKYALAFWATIISGVAAIFQFIIVYSSLMRAGQMLNYYIPAHLGVVGTGIFYGVSLIFSDTGKRPWLKATGVFTLIIGLVLVAAVVWYVNPQDPQKIETFEKIHQWVSLVGSVVPVLLIMNFSIELKELKKENVDSPPLPAKSLDNAMAIVGSIAGVATLILGSVLAGESISKLSWEKTLSVKAKVWAKLFEARTFKSTKGNTLQYQLLKPLDFDPQKKYPLVICLPFGGGVEGCPPAQVLLKDMTRRKYPSFLFVPFCPSGSGWGGIPNYPTIDTLVFESIRSLEEEFKEIDTKKIYVTGVSRGGYGSWHFISINPQMFAAAIPVCGGGDPNLAPGITDVAVWAFHGEDDRNVPVSGSRNMIQAIKNAGGDPKYTEFPDAGHNIWDMVSTTPGLLDWLFAQKRD